MKLPSLILLLAACGNPKGGDTTPTGNGSNEPPPPMKDTRTPFEKRLDAACSALGPTLTACAVADSDAKLAAGEISKKEHDDLTQQKYRDALDKKWWSECYLPDKLSSRQVRVLEVCRKEETECAPLLDCLTNFSPSKAEKAAKP